MTGGSGWSTGEQKHVDKVEVQLLSLAEVLEEAFEKIQAAVQVHEESLGSACKQPP